jgi:tetratricopeptide (TPR) repeat protein
MAEWLAATVHVARNSLPEAARALDAGIATAAAGPPVRFSSVALHWLRGLLHLAGGDEVGALASFERELSTDPAGQLYARECAANTWYAIGALHLRRGRLDEARSAFTRAVDRVPGHRLARMALTMLRPRAADRRNHDEQEPAPPDRRPDRLVDAALGRAAALVLAGRLGASPRTDAARDAARVLDEALAASAPGSDGWLIPVEPVLQVQAAPEIWAPVLARLRARAV